MIFRLKDDTGILEEGDEEIKDIFFNIKYGTYKKTYRKKVPYWQGILELHQVVDGEEVLVDRTIEEDICPRHINILYPHHIY